MVVDDVLLTLIRPDMEKENLGSELDCLIRRDGPTTYLDYLRACEIELNEPVQEYPMFLTLHRDLIRRGLTKHSTQPDILSKYQWLRDYHEQTLNERFDAETARDLHV